MRNKQSKGFSKEDIKSRTPFAKILFYNKDNLFKDVPKIYVHTYSAKDMYKNFLVQEWIGKVVVSVGIRT